VVTSTNYPGQVNVFFSNAISASGSPTNFTLVSGALPGGLTFNSNNGTITGTPTSAVTNNITVTAENSFGTSSNATIGLEIAKGNQTITFTNNLAGLAVGSTNALTATASSGLSVTYTSSATNVATISGSSVVVVGTGSATITASQAGDDNWNPATATRALTAYPSGVIYWDFNTNTTTAAPAGWTIGAVSQGNNNGTTTMLTSLSPSSGYTNSYGIPASGGTNAGAAARTGAINSGTNGSAYFEFTVTAPNSSTNLAITNLSFGSRSTSTGPQSYGIRSSEDNYVANLAGGALLANSTWALASNSLSVRMTNGASKTFRVYGYNGTNAASANTANWRIDDLTLGVGELSLSNPSLNLIPNSLTGLSTFQGTPSVASSYVINGSNLSNSVTVTTSGPDLQISSDNTTFTNELSISIPNGGTLTDTTLYVRISSAAAQGALTGAYVRHVSTGITNDLAVSGNVYDATRGVSTNSLIGWDARGQTNFGPSPWSPTVVASNLIVSSGLSRTSGVTTGGSSAANGWGGVGWSQTDASAAVAANQYVFFTIAPPSGYKLSLSAISKLDYRRPASGPTGGVVQVQVGSGSFTDVANLSYTSTLTTGDSISAIDLSTNTALQNIPANTPVTFRIANFGGANTGSGTWYIYDKQSNPNLDFEVTGSVDVQRAVAPTITSTNAFSGTVGVAFSNTITATGSDPIAFSGIDLPGGLSVAPDGVISGTPTAAGTNNATLTATNAVGTTNQAATFTIAKGTPTISAAPTASDITLGQNLSSSTLSGGGASVEGIFSFTDLLVTPPAGTYSASVTFTPTNSDNYNTVTRSVNVIVNSLSILTITYDTQDGSTIPNGSTSTGASIGSSPGTPTRAGYTFAGWFAASTGGSAISFPYNHGQTADFTLYAQWTADSDTTPPVITLTGSTPLTVAWGAAYIDAGATATDNNDPSVTVTPSGSVNTAVPGTYTITYNATDAANNSSTPVTRTVTVSAPSSEVGADGLSGLLRYAFGANGPSDTVTKPTSTLGAGKLAITAIVRTNNPNLTVVGQAVTNLPNYASGTSIVEADVAPHADQANVTSGCQRQTFSVDQGIDAKKFLRLKATLNNP
jgi:uncharacterized repeat protein (TIGR02543 family)